MTWLSAFVDLTAHSFERGVEHWCDVTGYRLSERRGEDDEFGSLLPPEGDVHLKVQRLGEGPDRIHVDVHVADPRVAADRAVGLGARVDAEEHGYVVMSSPGGFPFCFVDHPASVRPPAATWPGGHRSQVDQVCLDIPPSRFESECRFWGDLMERELRATGSEEFLQVPRTAEEPVRILLQRLHDEQERVTAHLDLACDDRPAETERHLALGAVLERRFEHFTVLQDPTGMRYCITDRHPPR